MKHKQNLPKMKTATERLALCLQHNAAWGEYARKLEALNNERVDVIDQQAKYIQELEARLAVYEGSGEKAD